MLELALIYLKEIATSKPKNNRMCMCMLCMDLHRVRTEQETTNLPGYLSILHLGM